MYLCINDALHIYYAVMMVGALLDKYCINTHIYIHQCTHYMSRCIGLLYIACRNDKSGGSVMAQEVVLAPVIRHVIIGPKFYAFLLANSIYRNFVGCHIVSLKIFNKGVHSLAVMTFALHAKGPRFDPEWTQQNIELLGVQHPFVFSEFLDIT